jgi:hypothetical protein
MAADLWRSIRWTILTSALACDSQARRRVPELVRVRSGQSDRHGGSVEGCFAEDQQGHEVTAGLPRRGHVHSR